MLAKVGLEGKEYRDAFESLSYGERRALEIGVALAAEPRILFLDEPTSGLGSEGTRAASCRAGGAELRGALHHRHDRARHAVPVRARRPRSR